MSDYILGVDIGGTKVAVCGSNYSDVRQGILRFPSRISGTMEELEESIYQVVEEYIAVRENGKKPVAIGFGLKDAVDRKNGVWRESPGTKGFRPFYLRKEMEKRYHIPIFMDNDVHVATLAEMECGIGKKYDNFIYLNIGTGIAVGVVIEGRLLSGASNFAGEVGHFSLDSEGAVCPCCGQRGCFENIASGGAIVEQSEALAKQYPESAMGAEYRKQGRLTSRDVFALARQGDSLATPIYRRVFDSTRRVICGLVHLFNPEAVVLGGGVVSDERLLSMLQEEVPGHLMSASANALKEIVLSGLGPDYVGVLGAITLARMELGKD